VVDGAVGPRRAGISSFGAGGSNAHLVIEEYAVSEALEPVEDTVLIVLSARDEARLRVLAENLCVHIEAIAVNDPSQRKRLLNEIAFTLQAGREAMEERLGFVAVSLEEVVSILR